MNALVCITLSGLRGMYGFDSLTAVCSFRLSLKLPVQDKQLPNTTAMHRCCKQLGGLVFSGAGGTLLPCLGQCSSILLQITCLALCWIRVHHNSCTF